MDGEGEKELWEINGGGGSLWAQRFPNGMVLIMRGGHEEEEDLLTRCHSLGDNSHFFSPSAYDSMNSLNIPTTIPQSTCMGEVFFFKSAC